ncbi:ADAMTS-like protein 5 isoform X3 [Cynocephalus volans]|uniref:ADAMTS-like protein 5 isoform X3 n=1 Tax=Cynocephalus volans TaxID=110931 RepID=UPI002FCB8D89
MGKLRPGAAEWLASGHTGRDPSKLSCKGGLCGHPTLQRSGAQRRLVTTQDHTASQGRAGLQPLSAAAPLHRPLCSPRPRPFQNLLLLLWTLLHCGLGGSAQGPGEWTPWGSWSRCSSSCGRGVSVRSRRCIRFPEEEPCWGDTHEYRLCQLPDCPPGAVPFRDIQCALYNGRPVLGTQKTYQWVPFHGAPNQCDLNCLAEGHAFYHSFGRVLDGTPCSPGAQALCVAGRCLSAGCDGLLGSGTLEDRCGRCGGANDSCLFVQRVFRDSGAFAGYWNVTLIPEGARHIRVGHRSRNHLALMGGDGRYVLNGHWAVSPPGTYEAAGTRVVYTRAAGLEETLHAAGPTSQDLLLQTPAHPALTPAVVPTGCSTIAAATLCSRPTCWAAIAKPRRRAMKCVSSSSTRTARHCGPESMCGPQVAAPAHHWLPIESTCWLSSASSAPMAHRIGCCCLTLATPGPGALPRTAAHAWLPGTVLYELPEEPPSPQSKKDIQAGTQPAFQEARKYLPRAAM